MDLSSFWDQWASQSMFFLMKHRRATQKHARPSKSGLDLALIYPLPIALTTANHMVEPQEKGGTAESSIKGHGSKKGLESLKAIAVSFKQIKM